MFFDDGVSWWNDGLGFFVVTKGVVEKHVLTLWRPQWTPVASGFARHPLRLSPHRCEDHRSMWAFFVKAETLQKLALLNYAKTNFAGRCRETSTGSCTPGSGWVLCIHGHERLKNGTANVGNEPLLTVACPKVDSRVGVYGSSLAPVDTLHARDFFSRKTTELAPWKLWEIPTTVLTIMANNSRLTRLVIFYDSRI